MTVWQQAILHNSRNLKIKVAKSEFSHQKHCNYLHKSGSYCDLPMEKMEYKQVHARFKMTYNKDSGFSHPKQSVLFGLAPSGHQGNCNCILDLVGFCRVLFSLAPPLTSFSLMLSKTENIGMILRRVGISLNYILAQTVCTNCTDTGIINLKHSISKRRVVFNEPDTAIQIQAVKGLLLCIGMETNQDLIEDW